MCRIAVGGSGWKKEELRNIFIYLEASNGGDGNGIWVAGAVRKGVSLSAKEIAKVASRAEDVFVFHTRKKSTGAVDHHSVHPIEAGKNSYIIQNGTWSSWSAYRPSYNAKATTDTQVIAAMVKEHGPGVLLSSALSSAGVFVHMSGKDTVHIVKRSRRPLVYIRTASGRWMFVSEDVRQFINEPAILVEIPEHTALQVKNGKVLSVDFSAEEPRYAYTSGASYYEQYYKTPKAETYSLDDDCNSCGVRFQGEIPDEFSPQSAEIGKSVYHWAARAKESAKSDEEIEALDEVALFGLNDPFKSDPILCDVCPIDKGSKACKFCMFVYEEVEQ